MVLPYRPWFDLSVGRRVQIRQTYPLPRARGQQGTVQKVGYTGVFVVLDDVELNDALAIPGNSAVHFVEGDLQDI